MAVIAVTGSVFLAHELGRLNGGYSYLDQRRERDELTAVIAERDLTIEALRRQVAILETSQEIDQETYTLVEKNLDELQAQIQAQEEELAFYRGIISPEDGVAGLTFALGSVWRRHVKEASRFFLAGCPICEARPNSEKR